MLYLDSSGNLIDKWTNPWTNEEVTVVHVANDPVQQHLPNVQYPVDTSDVFSILTFDIPLFYPNPLANNETFAPYAPSKMYQAGEFFTFNYINADLESNWYTSIPVSITWKRLSQWLPWMKMKDAPGQLVFTGQGSKLSSADELNHLLRHTITSRSPLYLQAPKCTLRAADMTSWKYFEKYFDEYLQNALFPIYESHERHECLCAP